MKVSTFDNKNEFWALDVDILPQMGWILDKKCISSIF